MSASVVIVDNKIDVVNKSDCRQQRLTTFQEFADTPTTSGFRPYQT